jgi:hypothetical protein
MGLVSKRSEDDEPVEVRILGFGGLDLPGDEDLLIELDEWTDDGRRLLRERLDTLAVPHAWEGTTLVISPEQDAWVERILEQVEDELAVALDPDVEQVAYDLAGWDDEARQRLLTGLAEEEIAFGTEGDELFVHEIDERRVDELVDAIVDPEGPPSAAREGSAEVMGDLFVAADRLVHDPEDPDGRLGMLAAIEAASSAGSPYGVDQQWWDDTITACEALVDRLGEEPVDLDAAAEEASALRDRLRPVV